MAFYITLSDGKVINIDDPEVKQENYNKMMDKYGLILPGKENETIENYAKENGSLTIKEHKAQITS